jgi:hypothetical protein
VLECAVAAGSDAIVSGDADLLRIRSFRGIRIQKVSDFLAGFYAPVGRIWSCQMSRGVLFCRPDNSPSQTR